MLGSRPKTNRSGGQGGTGRGLSQWWGTRPNQLYPMISPLCPRGLGPNQKTKTGLMANNDGSVKGGTGSVGGPDKVFVLPSPYPPIISWHWGGWRGWWWWKETSAGEGEYGDVQREEGKWEKRTGGGRQREKRGSWRCSSRQSSGNRWGNTGEGSIGEQWEPSGAARLATVTAHLTQKTQCVMETDAPSHAFQHN